MPKKHERYPPTQMRQITGTVDGPRRHQLQLPTPVDVLRRPSYVVCPANPAFAACCRWRRRSPTKPAKMVWPSVLKFWHKMCQSNRRVAEQCNAVNPIAIRFFLLSSIAPPACYYVIILSQRSQPNPINHIRNYAALPEGEARPRGQVEEGAQPPPLREGRRQEEGGGRGPSAGRGGGGGQGRQ